ncbi:MAG TPA: TadE/TadG family type IV pilus assembly protein, partial [Vulgatibacter sp.]
MRSFENQRGQVAVETAIVLPLFLACLLGLLQLALLQQARLLTEYAAYQAARAGIVWNGDPGVMKDAAIFALAPTACPTRVPGASTLCAA